VLLSLLVTIVYPMERDESESPAPVESVFGGRNSDIPQERQALKNKQRQLRPSVSESDKPGEEEPKDYPLRPTRVITIGLVCRPSREVLGHLLAEVLAKKKNQGEILQQDQCAPKKEGEEK
jgi:hypothetical protein